ncbi:MAG: signal peptidase II [bacterium]|nr:signal peptidase II [bacterium]
MKRWVLFFTIALFFFSLDILTKEIIENKVPYLSEIKVTNFLNIVHIRNRGSIFGIFSDIQNEYFRLFMNILSIVVLVILFFFARSFSGLPFYTIGAMIGGALGNVYERIAKGYVVDFIDFHIGKYHWPAFNVADSIITIGIITVLIHSSSRSKKR